MRTKMMMNILILALFASFSFMTGCGEEEDEHTHLYTITMEPPGHVHTFGEADLTFKVTDEEEEPVTDLSPIVARQFQGSDRVSETGEGDIVDNGDGTYTWKRSFNDAGVYVLTFKFEDDGIMYSNSFPLETSKAGGERIYCPSEDNPEFAYQIRWEAVPGHIHGGNEAAFEIELKRSSNKEVNTEQPWLNSFDHLTPDDLKPAGSLPEVAIGSADGEESADVEYKGMGIYEVKHTFGDIHEDATYWLHVTFEDDCGVVDESGETEHDYQFSVVPAH
jgi:hypothetical protein